MQHSVQLRYMVGNGDLEGMEPFLKIDDFSYKMDTILGIGKEQLFLYN